MRWLKLLLGATEAVLLLITGYLLLLTGAAVIQQAGLPSSRRPRSSVRHSPEGGAGLGRQANVIPAHAGIQGTRCEAGRVGPRFRGDDEEWTGGDEERRAVVDKGCVDVGEGRGDFEDGRGDEGLPTRGMPGGAASRASQRTIRNGPVKRFAVLVPAHNEEALLGRLLDSLGRLDYPRNLLDIHVVADNCTDRTAEVAREHGAQVLERVDTRARGKGHALAWLLERLSARDRSYDAFIIVDADSYVSSNFLRVMNDRIASGSLVVQAYYTVANPAVSWNTGLRYVALALVHYLRPLGKQLFGGSAGLKGNGMCFAASVIKANGWNTFTLAEDVEYHLKLISSGIAVDFAADAVVWGEMPGSLRAAKSQDLRWERGRLELTRRYVPRLLWSGLRTHNIAQVDAALEQLVPPFSIPAALSCACLFGGVLARSKMVTLVALALSLFQLFYVVVGLVLVRAPKQIYWSLMRAPLFVLWKLWLYIRAIIGPGDRKWVRTARV